MNKLCCGQFKLKTSPYGRPTHSLLLVKYWSHYLIFIRITWAEHQLLQYYYSSATWAWAEYQLLQYYYYDIIVRTAWAEYQLWQYYYYDDIIMILLR